MIQKFHYKSYTRQTVLLVPSFKTKQPCILNKRNFECTIQTFHVLAQFRINTTYQLYPIHLIIHSFCYICKRMKETYRYIKAAKLIFLLPRLKEQQQLTCVLSMLDDITKRIAAGEIARSRSRVILWYQDDIWLTSPP